MAKVNLTLAVGAPGRDGYHPLRSVFVRIGLADELSVDFAPGASEDELTVAGLAGCPAGRENLVLRALSLLRGSVGLPLPPLRVHLEKNIPIGAGLAGGSSDGAAALQLAARAWGVGIAPEVEAGLAKSLGADVPFFARGGSSALVEGRGEAVTVLPPPSGRPGIVLALAAGPLATAAVYSRFDELVGKVEASAAAAATDNLVAALHAGLDGDGLAQLAPQLRDANDLWPAAADLVRDLEVRRDSLEQASGRPWLLSGSGPTLFALYPSLEEADSARRQLGIGHLLASIIE